MRIALAVVLVMHALLHLMGFVKAFGLVPVTQLTVPISRSMGVVWFAGAILLIAAAVTLFAAPKWFWLLAVAGVVASEVAIAYSWRDARFGTAANVLMLFAGVYGVVAWGPLGLRGLQLLEEWELKAAQRPISQPLPASARTHLESSRFRREGAGCTGRTAMSISTSTRSESLPIQRLARKQSQSTEWKPYSTARPYEGFANFIGYDRETLQASAKERSAASRRARYYLTPIHCGSWPTHMAGPCPSTWRSSRQNPRNGGQVD